MMIAASTMSPTATMIPPMDMMFMPMPMKYIGIKAMRIASGSVMIGIKADRRCNRNPMISTPTTISSSTRFSFAVRTDSRMRSLRS